MIEQKDQRTGEVYYWYEPREIYYNRDQVDWLCEHLQLLIDGKYPTEPSNYIELNGRSFKCSFLVAARIAAELTTRIEACGTDGYIAMEHYAQGKSIESICLKRGLKREKVESALNRVKSYICRHRDGRPWDDKNFKKQLSKGKTYEDYCKNWRER